jgi:MoaA/NifB/PqqE/SkfB family radical SAM enzyme
MDKKGDFNPEDINPSLDAIAYTLKKEKGTLKNLTKLAYLKGAKEFISGKRTMPCSAGEESVFIDAQGDVFPCIVMNHKLGNIYQNSLKDILNSPSSHEAREIIQKLECPTCWLECDAYRDIRKNWGMLLKALI